MTSSPRRKGKVYERATLVDDVIYVIMILLNQKTLIKIGDFRYTTCLGKVSKPGARSLDEEKETRRLSRTRCAYDTLFSVTEYQESRDG